MEFNKLLETFRNWSQNSQDYEALLKWCYDNTDKLNLSNPDYKYLYETATQYLIAIKVGKFNEEDSKFLINYLAKDFANDRGIKNYTIEILGNTYKEKTTGNSVAACEYSSRDGHSSVYYSQKVIEDLTSNNINSLLRGLQTIFHEMAHAGQIEILFTGNSLNQNAFRTALETVVDDFFFEFYTDNYSKLFRENQANFIGLDETRKLIKAYNKTLYNHCSNIIETKLKYYEDTMYSKKNQSILGKKLLKTNLVLSHVTENSIKKDLTLLEKYPILKKAYNLDGTKKNIIQLIEDRDNEISNTKDTETLDNLYYAITDYRLENFKEDHNDIITYVETTGRNDEFIEKMFQSILINFDMPKEDIKRSVETLHELANSVKIEKNNHIQSPPLKESIKEGSTDIKKDEKNQVSQNVQWMNTMKNFSNRVTVIEGYSKKQGEIVQEISMSERQKEVQKEDNLNHEYIEK